VSIDARYSNPDPGESHPDRQREPRASDIVSDRLSDRPRETRSRQEYYDSIVSGQSSEVSTSWPWTMAKPATERSEWQAPLDEGAVDRVGLGVIDERAKKFSLAERRIAEYLASEGPAVVAISEGYGVHGRTPDAQVDAISVEFKSLDPGASDRTVKAALNSAKGQARHAVIDARGSGLTEDEAQRGIRRFFGTPHGNRMDAVLIIGNNYSIDWKRGDD
jgi:Contact-dependent growth inhibition CdiA C-terminal domain